MINLIIGIILIGGFIIAINKAEKEYHKWFREWWEKDQKKVRYFL